MKKLIQTSAGHYLPNTIISRLRLITVTNGGVGNPHDLLDELSIREMFKYKSISLA
jgi:hypothetical protein